MSDNIKSLFAYSSVAQIGYMMLGVSLVTVSGIAASIIYIFNHAIIKAAVFIGIGCIVYRLGSEKIVDMKGVFTLMPMTSIAILIACLGLIGIPSTAGFISKWYLLLSVVEQKAWLSLFVILLGSLMSIIYVWRLFEVMYFDKPDAQLINNKNSVIQSDKIPASMILSLWVLVILSLYFGLETSFTYGLAEAAGKYLLMTK